MCDPDFDNNRMADKPVNQQAVENQKEPKPEEKRSSGSNSAGSKKKAKQQAVNLPGHGFGGTKF